MWPLGPGEAWAASNTCGSLAHKFAGAYVASPNPSRNPHVVAADARIQYQIAGLCTSATGTIFSIAWSMVATSDNKWAQIGWWHGTNLSDIRFFWQWKKGTSLPTYYWGVASLGSGYTFEVVRQTDHYLHMYKDGSPAPCIPGGGCVVTNWDPNSSSSSSAQFFGEVNYPGSDVSGSSSVHDTFSGVQELWNGTWNDYAWTLSADCPYYHRQSVSSYTIFDIWTDPLSHNSTCS
jgi:hypothetical protein